MKISTLRPFRPNFLKKNLVPLPKRHISSAGHGKAKSITRPNHIRIEAVNHPSELIHSPLLLLTTPLSPMPHPSPTPYLSPFPTPLPSPPPPQRPPFPLPPPPSTSVMDDAKIPERLSRGAAKERPNPAKKRNLWILDWKESPARWPGRLAKRRTKLFEGYGQGYPG